MQNQAEENVVPVAPATGPTVDCHCAVAAEAHIQRSAASVSGPQSLAAGAETSAAREGAMPSSTAQGEWSAPFQLDNVAIHTHVLYNGKVLFWGRRKQPTDNSFSSLNEWETHSFLFDPATLKCMPTGNQPTTASGDSINLFCSSHTFLPDGRLMVTGGHLFDSQGIDSATIYDPVTDTWSPAEPMQGQTTSDPGNSHWKNGRWYPTAITLADGAVFVCSGTFATAQPAPAPEAPGIRNNSTPEIWDAGPWKQLLPFVEATDLQQFLFPRFHLAPDGRVFMSGPGPDCFIFDPSGTGAWSQSATRQAGPREYAPSVMYDIGKIVFIGGGNDPGTHLPSQLVEKIDLTVAAPAWEPAAPMHFRRRQHNATLLPDGTVLVTGGTQGPAGAGGQGFNDLSPGQPIHVAELWDPKADEWTLMAEERTDRCYHSTAVLLPDGRVLSAGGGEYQPTDQLRPNAPADTHLDAQLFSPPYLFRGPRPELKNAPTEIRYGQSFIVQVTNSMEIAGASLVSLSSVTHSFNTSQRINFLTLHAEGTALTLTAPPNANVCPPGFYLLFLLSAGGVPSRGKIVQVTGEPEPPPRFSVEVVDQLRRSEAIRARASRPELVVGLTPVCPYGLATCWGGAYRALKMLEAVEQVFPVADNSAAVATLYLKHDGIPDLNAWPAEFERFANGSYTWRGVEMTLVGTIAELAGILTMPATSKRPEVTLLPLQRAHKVQLDQTDGVDNPLSLEEANAYAELAAAVRNLPGWTVFAVTGPIRQTLAGFQLEVRLART